MLADLLADPFFAPLPDLLRDVFGSNAAIDRVTIPNQHAGYAVLLVQLRQPTLNVVVKLAGHDAPYPCPFERTAALHALLRRETALPVAEFYAADETYAHWQWRYSVQEQLSGTEWAALRPALDVTALADAYSQLGEAVGQMHGVTFPAFGDVDTPTQDFRTAFEARARALIRSPRLQNILLNVVDERRDLFDISTPRLSHEDLHGHNLLFANIGGRWTLSGILDFEKAWAGHHETDLARLELWRGMTAPAFWDAYSFSLDEGYAQRCPVYQLFWCFEYAANTPQHLADTRAVCAELGIPPVEAFDSVMDAP